MEENLLEILNYTSELYSDFNTRECIPESGYLPKEVEYSDATYLETVQLFSVDNISDVEITQKWTEIKTSMAGTYFTEKNLRDLVICAMNLKGLTQNSKPLLYSSAPRTNIIYDTSVDTAPIPTCNLGAGVATVSGGGRAAAATTAVEDVESQARAISFISCAFVRLIRKDVGHVQKALPEIRRAYRRFYGRRSTLLTDFTPTMAWEERVKVGFNTYKVIPSTVSYHLAKAEEKIPRTDGDYGLCRYLLFQHLELMGMQIYKMAVALMTELKLLTTAQFLTWIEVPYSQESLSKILRIMRDFDNPTKNPKTYYWKYARLSNSGYFLDLSLGRNKYLGSLLAKLTKAYSLGGNQACSDPENMAAIKNIGKAISDDTSDVAATFVNMYNTLVRGVPQLVEPLSRGMPVIVPRNQQRGSDSAGSEHMEEHNQAPPRAPKRRATDAMGEPEAPRQAPPNQGSLAELSAWLSRPSSST